MRLQRGIALLLPLLLSPVFAQIDNSGLLPYMPADVQQVRAMQVDWAIAADIAVSFHDEGMRSATGLRGVPSWLRTVFVKDEQILIEQIERLYPLFGFRGSESLRFVEKQQVMDFTTYRFRQYINDIPTPQLLRFDVDPKTGIILRMPGTLVLDRGFARASAIPEADAIQCGKAYIRSRDPQAFSNIDGDPTAMLMYRWGEDRVLEPWWEILTPSEEGQSAPFLLLNPYGAVLSPIQSSHHTEQSQLGSCYRLHSGELIFEKV